MTLAKGGHVLVLGAGIVGVTSAYFLARAGFRVTVVDRQDGAGLETSFANGGLVTPSMSDPWAAPGLPLKGSGMNCSAVRPGLPR